MVEWSRRCKCDVRIASTPSGGRDDWVGLCVATIRLLYRGEDIGVVQVRQWRAKSG